MKELKNIKIYFAKDSGRSVMVHNRVYVQFVGHNLMYIISPDNKNKKRVVPLYNVLYFTIEDCEE